MKAFTAALLFGLAAAAPTPAEKRWPADAQIKPDYISQYSIKTGALDYLPPSGKSVFDTISTISVFTITPAAAGKKCKVNFWLDAADAKASIKGSGVAQVFTSSKIPPPYDVANWGPPGNMRDQHYGNLKVVKGGAATVDDWPQTLLSFDCGNAGQRAFEFVAKWDVSVEWDQAVSGMYLTYQ